MNAYDVYWAEFLGIEPADWMGSHISFRAHAGLRGYRGLWCFRRGVRVVVSSPPGWVPRLEALWSGWDHERLLDATAVEVSLGEDCDRCIGPAFQGCLDPGSFVEVESSRVRALVASDRAGVDSLRERCGPDAWGGLDDVGLRGYVYLDGTEITAMAGLRDRGDGVGDLCVVTHPQLRGQGRGAAVVSAATRAALANDHLVLYQTLESNLPAVSLALSLGFTRYASHLAVRLKADAPRDRGSTS